VFFSNVKKFFYQSNIFGLLYIFFALGFCDKHLVFDDLPVCSGSFFMLVSQIFKENY